MPFRDKMASYSEPEGFCLLNTDCINLHEPPVFRSLTSWGVMDVYDLLTQGAKKLSAFVVTEAIYVHSNHDTCFDLQERLLEGYDTNKITLAEHNGKGITLHKVEFVVVTQEDLPNKVYMLSQLHHRVLDVPFVKKIVALNWHASKKDGTAPPK